MTITDKLYAIKDNDGNLIPFTESDPEILRVNFTKAMTVAMAQTENVPLNSVNRIALTWEDFETRGFRICRVRLVEEKEI